MLHQKLEFLVLLQEMWHHVDEDRQYPPALHLRSQIKTAGWSRIPSKSHPEGDPQRKVQAAVMTGID